MVDTGPESNSNNWNVAHCMIKWPGFRVSSLDARSRPNHQLDVGLPTITQSKDPSGPPGAGVLSLRCLSAYPHVGCNPRSWEVWNGVQGSIEFFFKIFFFFMWPILKSLLNLLQYCFCSMFWLFGHEACGSQLTDQGLNLHLLHWKAKS